MFSQVVDEDELFNQFKANIEDALSTTPYTSMHEVDLVRQLIIHLLYQ